MKEFSKRAVKDKQAYDIPFRAVIGDGTIKYLHHVGKPNFEEPAKWWSISA